MKLGVKVHLFSLIIPASSVLLIILFGLSVMNRVIYDQNYKLIFKELENITKSIETEQEILRKAGVENFPHYIKQAKGDFLTTIETGRFKLSGDLYILDTVSNSNINKRGEEGLDYISLDRALFKEISGEIELKRGNAKYYANYVKVPYWDWIVVLMITEKELFLERTNFLKYVIPLSLLPMLIGILLSYFSLKSVFSRIVDSLNCLNEVEKGNLDSQITVLPVDDEIQQIQKAINTMISSLKESYSDLEMKVQYRTEEISHLNQYLKNIIDSMPSILIGIDNDLKINKWNPAAEKISSISENDILGKDLSEVLKGKNDMSTDLLNQITSGSGFTRNQMKIRLGESQDFYADISYFPLSKDHNETGIIQINDITERFHLEELMIQSEKMLTIGSLAAGMAHEINNPLAGMIHSAQNINRRLSKDIPGNIKIALDCGLEMNALANYSKKRNIPEMIQSILDSGKKAAEIVENMISFSSGDVSVKKENDIEVILENAVSLVMRELTSVNVNILREYENELPPVPCEDSKIQQVFYNILRNALQAMHKYKTENPLITLKIQKIDNEILIIIEDNGPGIEDKIKKRVFEPFFSTNEVNEGMGLGLSVCYFIIREHHNGILRMGTERGKGTSFFITLPLGS